MSQAKISITFERMKLPLFSAILNPWIQALPFPHIVKRWRQIQASKRAFLA
jgi:hypothetical protein